MKFIRKPDLEIAAKSIKIISLFGLVLGIVFFMASIMFDWPRNEVLIMLGIIFLSIFLLIVTENLLRRKKWAWYAGLILSGLGFISCFFLPSDFIFFVGILSFFIAAGLISGRKKIFA